MSAVHQSLRSFGNLENHGIDLGTLLDLGEDYFEKPVEIRAFHGSGASG